MTIIPRFQCVLKDQLKDYITAISWSMDSSLFVISASGELIHFLPGSSNWDRYGLHPGQGTEDKNISTPGSTQKIHDTEYDSLSQQTLNCVGAG